MAICLDFSKKYFTTNVRKSILSSLGDLSIIVFVISYGKFAKQINKSTYYIINNRQLYYNNKNVINHFTFIFQLYVWFNFKIQNSYTGKCFNCEICSEQTSSFEKTATHGLNLVFSYLDFRLISSNYDIRCSSWC
jgi:hypothetical protein